MIRPLTSTILFGCFLLNCSWTPQVETVLHDTAEGYVSLRTLTDETVRVSHPAEISDTVLTRIFQGLQKQQNIGLLQELVTGSPQPTTIFSMSQITFLTPLVKKALAQATKEEEVYFRLTNIDDSTSSVGGSLFIYGPTLMLTIHPKMPPGSGKNMSSAKSLQSGRGKFNFNLTFSPKEALSTNEVPQGTRLKPFNSRHTIRINISKVEKMAVNLAAPSQEATTQKLTHSEDSMSTSKTSAPPLTSTKSQTPNSIKPAITINHATEASALIQQLQKQMDALKKQLREQKAEIERLKKQ